MNETTVKIEYAALPNQYKEKGGWAPATWVNGREQVTAWHHKGFMKADALKRARAIAEEEADHYIGDWDVTITKRKEKKETIRDKASGVLGAKLNQLERDGWKVRRLKMEKGGYVSGLDMCGPLPLGKAKQLAERGVMLVRGAKKNPEGVLWTKTEGVLWTEIGAGTYEVFRKVKEAKHRSPWGEPGMKYLGYTSRHEGTEWMCMDAKGNNYYGFVSKAAAIRGLKSAEKGKPVMKKNPKKGTKKPKVKTTMAQVKAIMRQLWAKAIKNYPELKNTKLITSKAIHDSPRSYGRYYHASNTIGVAPEITQLSAAHVRGVLAHELGHAVVDQTSSYKAAKGYDAIERQADRAAEKACGLKVYYDKVGVQVAGAGAQGVRPRPKGLR